MLLLQVCLLYVYFFIKSCHLKYIINFRIYVYDEEGSVTILLLPIGCDNLPDSGCMIENAISFMNWFAASLFLWKFRSAAAFWNKILQKAWSDHRAARHLL